MEGFEYDRLECGWCWGGAAEKGGRLTGVPTLPLLRLLTLLLWETWQILKKKIHQNSWNRLKIIFVKIYFGIDYEISFHEYEEKDPLKMLKVELMLHYMKYLEIQDLYFIKT